MTTRLVPPGPQRTGPLPQDPKPKRGITRALLCLLLVILFLLFFKSSDVLQLLGLVVAFLSINFFEPIFSVIDTADPFVARALGEIKLGLRHLVFFHIPGIGSGIRKRLPVIIPIVCLFAVVYLLFHNTVSGALSTFNDFSCLRTSVPVPAIACNSGLGLTTLPNGARIGLIASAEQGPFDLSSLNGEEKQVEVAIFRENATACSGPHVTLAEVTLLSRTIEDPESSAAKGLDDLRGAYLAQHDYNAKRAKYNPTEHDGRPFVSLCLLLVNLGTLVTADQTSGPQLYSMPQVVHQLVQYARHDPTFQGIIGFPYSAQAEEAINLFSSWWGRLALPIVSPSATSYKLSNVPNFYRVSSSDTVQAQAMAIFACKMLIKNSTNASVDIFTNSDPYSSSLSSKFEQFISRCIKADNLHQHHEPYQNGDAQSIRQAAQNAINNNYHLLFFPGYEGDLDTLQAQIQQSAGQGSTAPFTILGGDGLVDVVNPNHNTFVTTYASVYATPLSKVDPASMQFVAEYVQQKFPLPYLASAIAGYVLLPQAVIRSYNATRAFTSTLESLAGHNLEVMQENINTTIASINYDGIGVHIALQGDALNSGIISDPQNTIIYIMCTSHKTPIQLAAIYNGGNDFTLEQGACSTGSSS